MFSRATEYYACYAPNPGNQVDHALLQSRKESICLKLNGLPMSVASKVYPIRLLRTKNKSIISMKRILGILIIISIMLFSSSAQNKKAKTKSSAEPYLLPILPTIRE